VGAILSSLALIMMPRSSALWMAAGLLWILDASINISMEPFRAFVADLLPDEQRTTGFAAQSVMIGLGAVIASALPWILTNFVHLKPEAAGAHAIPLAVRLSFYIGAAAFLSAVLWTICTTREYPPEDMEAFRKAKATRHGFGQTLREVASAISQMPRTMRQLAPVQLLTWLGLFCMWLYFPVAVARNVFGAASEKAPEYSAGIEWAGICFGLYSAVCFVFSFFLPALAKAVGRKTAHSLCLAAGAVGLLSVGVIHNQYVLLLSMLGVGIAWVADHQQVVQPAD
jgi:maltose/moltooligosaccharide transporter